MGRIRVFYGHEGVVPPTGLRSRAAAATPEESDVDEIVEEGDAIGSSEVVDADGTPALVREDGTPAPAAAPRDVEERQALPDESWTKGDLLTFAEARGIDMTGATKTKPAALARVLESLEEK